MFAPAVLRTTRLDVVMILIRSPIVKPEGLEVVEVDVVEVTLGVDDPNPAYP